MNGRHILGHGKNGPGVRAWRFKPRTYKGKARHVLYRFVRGAYFEVSRTTQDTSTAYARRCLDASQVAPIWRYIIAG